DRRAAPQLRQAERRLVLVRPSPVEVEERGARQLGRRQSGLVMRVSVVVGVVPVTGVVRVTALLLHEHLGRSASHLRDGFTGTAVLTASREQQGEAQR